MPENEAENQKEPEVSSAPAAPKKGNKLPFAVGGLVFVICVVVFSFKFGVFSQSNVAQPAAAGTEQTEDLAGDIDREDADDDYLPMFGDDDYAYESEEEFSAEDSVEQVKWYEAQKQEIRQERIELEKEKARLTQLRDQVESLLQRRAAIEDANIAAMAKLYENMNPEEVVPILTNLEDAQVSLIISKMKKRAASDVMGQLAPDRAAKITQWLISLETGQQ